MRYVPRSGVMKRSGTFRPRMPNRPTGSFGSSSGVMKSVGSRGLGYFSGLLLGSVSQAVLHRATCPVAVVR